MNKQQRIKELDELIAKAQAEREQLAKEKTLWVPKDWTFYVIDSNTTIYVTESFPEARAKFGHAAPDKEKAEQLRDFFAELVPKHPMPEVGQEFWQLVGGDFDFVVQLKWKGRANDYAYYNAGQTWGHKPTPEEIERKRKALAFDSSWRWV